jgi:hypothetical protein
MLPNAQKYDRNAGRMHHADQSSNHITNGIALRDDETVHANAVISQLSLQQAKLLATKAVCVEIESQNGKAVQHLPWYPQTPSQSFSLAPPNLFPQAPRPP